MGCLKEEPALLYLEPQNRGSFFARDFGFKTPALRFDPEAQGLKSLHDSRGLFRLARCKSKLIRNSAVVRFSSAVFSSVKSQNNFDRLGAVSNKQSLRAMKRGGPLRALPTCSNRCALSSPTQP